MDYTKENPVPKDLKEKMAFLGFVKAPEYPALHFQCQDWDFENDVLTLRGVLFDSSERAKGVTLKWCVSYLPVARFGGVSWMVRPLQPEETKNGSTPRPAWSIKSD